MHRNKTRTASPIKDLLMVSDHGIMPKTLFMDGEEEVDTHMEYG
jgi:hypothetical protein